MREKLARTVLSLLAVLAAVFAFRWTVRTALTRVYRAESTVRPLEVAVEPADKVHDLAALVPKELEVNIAGLSVRRRAERMHMPYALAVDMAAARHNAIPAILTPQSPHSVFIVECSLVAYLSLWRSITSSCQRFESDTNRAEKPQTRTMMSWWRSGWICASRSSSTELQFGCIM